jgi:hypothetical protein
MSSLPPSNRYQPQQPPQPPGGYQPPPQQPPQPPGGYQPPPPMPPPGGYPPPSGYPPPQQPATGGGGRGCLYAILGAVLAVVIIVGGLVAIGVLVDDNGPSPTPTSQTSTPTGAGTGTKAADRGDFKPFYSSASDPTNQVIENAAKDSRLVEEIASGLNQAFSLPRDVAIGMGECGEPNAFYSASDKQLIICYELFAFLLKVFQSDTDKVAGALTFIIFHELGHAVIDIYQLPAVGREEDAADQLAALVLISGGADEAESVIAAAEFFDKISSNELDFADEHSLNQQRVYNILCWLYGSNPKKYSTIVTSGILPQSRAERCPDEYNQVERSWNKLLEPYVKS